MWRALLAADMRLCGSPLPPCPNIQSKRIPFPLFWSEGNLLSQFQGLRAWMQAELLEVGISGFIPYQR